MFNLKLRRTISLIALVFVPSSLRAQAQGEEVRCAYLTAKECSASQCATTVPKDLYLLVPSLRTLSTAANALDDSSRAVYLRRCDSFGCSPVKVVVESDLSMLTIWRADAGNYMLSVVVKDDGLAHLKKGDFIEVTLIGMRTLTYWGHCPRL